MKKLMLLITLIIAGLIGFTDVAIADGDVTFTWDLPTERTDNTPLPASEIAGFNIFGNDETFEVTGAVTTATKYYIGRGQTEFRIQTVDTDGRVSDLSDPVYVNLSAPPKKPVNFKGVKQ